MRVAVIFFVCFGVQTVAQAYLGPGLGVGTIAVVLGFIGSILLAIFALLYYPIKRMIKRKRRKQAHNIESETNMGEEDPNQS